jgi:pimeloyl-ACP methyl ester carboxylesterase
VTRRGLALAGTVEAPWQLAAPWGGRGYLSELRGGRVHWIEFGAQTGGPPLVFVHGLGGSHLNWVLVGAEAGGGRRSLALDLHGFGLTPGNRSSATIAANTALLHQFVTEVAGAPVILVGNSMGGMLSILAAHAHPESVAGLVLVAPVVPAAPRRPDLSVAAQFLMYAVPGLGEAYIRARRDRAEPRQQVQNVISLCFADPARADPAVIEASVDLARLRHDARGTEESMLAAARSLLQVTARARRYWAQMAALGVPVLLIGGSADRLVPAASIRAAGARNPGWETIVLAGVGHTAQLERPAAVTGLMRAWLDRNFPFDAEE